jgi:hypothetical protein
MACRNSFLKFNALRSLLLVPAIFSCLSSVAQKTDKVYFQNGDYILGEITSLDRAILLVDSEYAGKVKIDWEDVQMITTDKTYIIQLENGDLYTGTFTFTDFNSFAITADEGSLTVTRDEVVRMIMYNRRVWQRFEGELGVGLDFSSASKVFQINLFSNLSYVGPKYRSELSFENLFTNIIGDSTKYSKRDLTLNGVRLFRNSWFMLAEYKFEQNSEQGYDSRNTITLNGGINFLQSQHTDMIAMLGVNYNRENFTTEETGKTGTNNVELPATWQFEAFLNDPDVKSKLAFTYYPSMTDPGRHRFHASVRFSLEFLDDFEFGLEFYNDFDNRIPSTGEKSNDYGVISSLSYSFD